MRPTLISIGFLEFHSYTVALALAFLAGVLLPIRENYRLEKPYPATPMVGLFVFLGALIGARGYWILQYDTWRHLYRAVYVWQGGLVFYGGLIGGVAGCLVYLRVKRIPLLPAADLALPFVPLAHAIGRIGCFLNGCCWGMPTDMPWGVTFPKSRWGVYAQHLKDGLVKADAPCALPVHPTQLYEMAGLLAIFAIIRYAYKHKSPYRDGSVMVLYPLFYGILRFLVEDFRGDSGRPVFGLTVSQLISLGMIVFAGMLWVLLRLFAWRKKNGGGLEAESSQ